MGRRTIAPRLRLLGLLLISASIVMGLLLSALGVQSVTLSSPFVKEIAESVQNVSNTAASHFESRNSSHATPVLPAAIQSSGASTGYQNGLESNAVSAKPNEPLTVSLWALVAPISLVGILLWMTPMPESASGTNRSYKRH